MSVVAQSRLWASIAAFVFISASLAALASRRVAPVVRELEGRIEFIDLNRAIATLAFAHPRTGAPLKVTGHITPNCVILINGRQGAAEELAEGDLVRVTVEVHPIGRRIEVVRVERRSNDSPKAPAGDASERSQAFPPAAPIDAARSVRISGWHS